MAYLGGVHLLLAMSQVLQSEKNGIADGVLTLILNRPDQRNSLTRELLSELTAVL
jgi:enoyl-CoA hydratase/carnithine racemase